jgi:hypothetical protein
MTQRDYAESWAWVHWLLESQPARRKLLREYLANLRENGQAPPLSDVLAQHEASKEQALITHLQVLDSRTPAALRQ